MFAIEQMLLYLIVHVLHTRHLSFVLSEYIFADSGRKKCCENEKLSQANHHLAGLTDFPVLLQSNFIN